MKRLQSHQVQTVKQVAKKKSSMGHLDLMKDLPLDDEGSFFGLGEGSDHGELDFKLPLKKSMSMAPSKATMIEAKNAIRE